jgi:ribonucleoside-diphosphate reductase alpha chain
LEKRYLRRDSRGEVVETPAELFRRVADAVASAERKYASDTSVRYIADEFYRIMSGLLFLPNSPTLLNAGTTSGQLSACFVLPVEDSIEAIFEAVKYTAQIHKSGGGTGFSFAHVRPVGDDVDGRADAATGPVALIDVFSKAADYVRQGGIRRGCNSVVLPVDHPDIMDFIKAKADPLSLTNFYISVAVTDDFMRRVGTGQDYPLINPRNGQITGWLNAGAVFDRIVDQAWSTGDPGFVFIDQINRTNPTPHLGRIEIISGCGEQTLLPYESCNLGSINLAKMVKLDNNRTVVDFDTLKDVVSLAVRFLDNVIDVNKFPISRIEEMTKRTRKIGLGVMGFADMLYQMGIPYNSESAVKIARDVMSFVKDEAHRTSRLLARERGPFPAFKGSIYDREGLEPMRNAACTTVAPTGTLSIIAGCSSGIEPVFAGVFVRNILDGENLLEVNPHFEKAVKDAGVYSEELLARLVKCNHLHDQHDVPEEIRKIFVTAHQVSPEWHVKIQAAFQEFTDNAVSKTVNFARQATREELASVFRMAYESGLKGITVYRDDSRELQPLCTGDTGIELVKAYFMRH